MSTQHRIDREQQLSSPAPHPHYTLATLIVIGIVGTLAAIGLAVGAMAITASRNSVDDALVASKVDDYMATAAPTANSIIVDDVVPDLVPKAALHPVPAGEVNVAVAPNVPAAASRTAPAIVAVHFEVVEQVSTIDPESGLQTETWGYRIVGGEDDVIVGTPGPMIRARVGDLLRFTITNPATNSNPHNVDFHAVTGQGGGAEASTVAPGETKSFEGRLLYPGFFMYHCAYGDIPAHIAHGMYGGILVDPATPLPPVDKEWYIVQSEYYTSDASTGVAGFDRAAVTAEHPSFVVFNGARGSLMGDSALTMNVGERGRIYFVNAGVNLASNFHPIGSHWDVVYPEAALLSQPLRGSQTTLVPAGGGTVVELVAQVPSTVVLVNHALARAVDKGAIGQIVISGEANPEIFEDLSEGPQTSTTAGHTMQPGEQISIVPGAWMGQSANDADEFADTERPADYSVNVLRIKVGTTVTWTNNDDQIHTVTDEAGTFDSGFLNPGDTWSYTFETARTYGYLCTPHPWMRARVIVEP